MASGPDDAGNVVHGWTTVTMADGAMLFAADLGFAYDPQDLGLTLCREYGMPLDLLHGGAVRPSVLSAGVREFRRNC
jgi:hypothetical protein